MSVVSVPNVGVLKPVDVDLAVAVGVNVHVGYEKCFGPSKSLPSDLVNQPAEFYLGPLSPPAQGTNWTIFYFEKSAHGFASHSQQKISSKNFNSPDFEALAAKHNKTAI